MSDPLYLFEGARVAPDAGIVDVRCVRNDAARTTDPPTSKAAATRVPRMGEKRAAMLEAFAKLTADGNPPASDAEAARTAGLFGTRCCWWKRASELRADGLIEVVGIEKDRETLADVQVCRITRAGRETLRTMGGRFHG